MADSLFKAIEQKLLVTDLTRLSIAASTLKFRVGCRVKSMKVTFSEATLSRAVAFSFVFLATITTACKQLNSASDTKALVSADRNNAAAMIPMRSFQSRSLMEFRFVKCIASTDGTKYTPENYINVIEVGVRLDPTSFYYTGATLLNPNGALFKYKDYDIARHCTVDLSVPPLTAKSFVHLFTQDSAEFKKLQQTLWLGIRGPYGELGHEYDAVFDTFARETLSAAPNQNSVSQKNILDIRYNPCVDTTIAAFQFDKKSQYSCLRSSPDKFGNYLATSMNLPDFVSSFKKLDGIARSTQITTKQLVAIENLFGIKFLKKQQLGPRSATLAALDRAPITKLGLAGDMTASGNYAGASASGSSPQNASSQSSSPLGQGTQAAFDNYYNASPSGVLQQQKVPAGNAWGGLQDINGTPAKPANDLSVLDPYGNIRNNLPGMEQQQPQQSQQQQQPPADEPPVNCIMVREVWIESNRPPQPGAMSTTLEGYGRRYYVPSQCYCVDGSLRTSGDFFGSEGFKCRYGMTEEESADQYAEQQRRNEAFKQQQQQEQGQQPVVGLKPAAVGGLAPGSEDPVGPNGRPESNRPFVAAIRPPSELLPEAADNPPKPGQITVQPPPTIPPAGADEAFANACKAKGGVPNNQLCACPGAANLVVDLNNSSDPSCAEKMKLIADQKQGITPGATDQAAANARRIAEFKNECAKSKGVATPGDNPTKCVCGDNSVVAPGAKVCPVRPNVPTPQEYPRLVAMQDIQKFQKEVCLNEQTGKIVDSNTLGWKKDGAGKWQLDMRCVCPEGSVIETGHDGKTDICYSSQSMADLNHWDRRVSGGVRQWFDWDWPKMPTIENPIDGLLKKLN